MTSERAARQSHRASGSPGRVPVPESGDAAEPASGCFSRQRIVTFWIPAIFTAVLLFCLFQLGWSIYRTQWQQPLQKLSAISAFAS